MGINLLEYLVSAESDKLHWNIGERGFTTPCGVYSVANKNADVVIEIKEDMRTAGLNYKSRMDVLTYDRYMPDSKRKRYCAMATTYTVSKYFKLPSEITELLDERSSTVYFSLSVNMGKRQANKLLQRALGVEADGFVGRITIGALVDEYISLRKVYKIDTATDSLNVSLVYRLLYEGELYYKSLAKKRRYAKYLRGWLNRLRNLAKLVGVDYAWID